MKRFPPTDFDWVKARSECSIALAFKELEADATQDVDRINKIRNGNFDPTFQITSRGRSFFVNRIPNTRSFDDPASVKFTLDHDEIVVSSNGEISGFSDCSLTVGLNDL